MEMPELILRCCLEKKKEKKKQNWGTQYFLWFKEQFFSRWKPLDLCPLELLKFRLEGLQKKWAANKRCIQKQVKKVDQV